MRRATPLGHDEKASAKEREQNLNPAPAETPVPVEDPKFARPFSVIQGGAPAAPRRNSGPHRRRMTPARAVVQPSDPEQLRKALEAMRAMNELTRRRTSELRRLSEVTRDLTKQMDAFGSVIGGLKIGPERRSAGG